MKGRRFRVFISHSANRTEEPETQCFLDRLCNQLSANSDIEVLVDQRSLQAGDEWCQRLYAWMGLCDAAVILLSPRAVQRENSSWVPREVNILLWRKAIDPDFLVLPVLVSGLERSDISDNPFVADAGLAELQFAESTSDDEKLALICEALADRAAASSNEIPFNAIQVFIEDSISRFAPRAAVDATLAARYADDPWRPYQQAPGLLAVKMVKNAVVKEVDAVISDVSRGSQPEYQLGARLFQALFPLRLPAEPSCTLLALCRQQVGQGAVVINCHDTWAVRMMLRAATGQLKDDFLRSWRIIELPDGWGDDDETEIIHYLAHELAEAVLGTSGWELVSGEPDPLGALAVQLAEFSQESQAPILVCTAFSPRWSELAPLLAARFPTTVFLLWSGAMMPASFDSESGRVVRLEPALPRGVDRNWNLSYCRKMQLLGS
ncbi:MAG: toll/interleukin-1 receptor domain-containing protein [Gammaproteobacteria bacterium]|nr:toll/interleukin-1 receptor domain-containing protein [Gammaproteobacteria bacterium]